MYEVAIEVKFDAAHRLLGYEGKCKFLHGHSYVAIVCLSRRELEGPGFVIDFGFIKKHVKGWIDKFWDHAVILNKEDKLVTFLSELRPDEISDVLESVGGINQQEITRRRFLCDRLEESRVFVMYNDPTAERMAELLFNVVSTACPDKIPQVIGIANAGGFPLEASFGEIENPITVEYVTIKETATSWATYRPGEEDAS